ncbi:hypothetical protein GYMLUDRAFT_359669 [Collybiopsis luxurians FD-317 M1]|nr:hypothetical protein GYMLUDRAFT_359669 [Collybiopsis luxurians FD-317 M1]
MCRRLWCDVLYLQDHVKVRKVAGICHVDTSENLYWVVFVAPLVMDFILFALALHSGVGHLRSRKVWSRSELVNVRVRDNIVYFFLRFVPSLKLSPLNIGRPKLRNDTDCSNNDHVPR